MLHVVTAADASEYKPIFKWDTLHEIGPRTLQYVEPIHGMVLEIELTCGKRVQVFRGADRQFYFCHGLTFGGIRAPGGPVSPFSGKDVQTILDNYYFLVEPESDAACGDVLVWSGLGQDMLHSAILIEPVVEPGTKYLHYRSGVRTKNGRLPEAEMTLERLTGDEFNYGDSFGVFRLR